MVPVDGLAFEDEHHDDGEDGEGDHFLDHFQLKQVEGPAVACETYAVGGYGEAVFEEGDAPRKKDDEDQRPVGRDLHLAEFQVSIPGEGHKDVRKYEHHHGPKSVHLPT